MLDRGQQVYVVQVTSEHKVQLERSIDAGGGRFWVDGAAFLAAVLEDRGRSEDTEVSDSARVNPEVTSSSV